VELGGPHRARPPFQAQGKVLLRPGKPVTAAEAGGWKFIVELAGEAAGKPGQAPGKLETVLKCGRDSYPASFVYLSDEFSLLAGDPFPPVEAYDGFWQVDNAIGLTPRLRELWKEELEWAKEDGTEPTVPLTVLTGELAAAAWDREFRPVLEAAATPTVEVIGVPNTFYGHTVTVAGLLSGDDATERRQHALIGAGVGGLAGGAIGRYQDNQERALRERMQGTGVDVVRDGDHITLDMPEAITFAFNSSTLNRNAYSVLDRVADTLREYDQTMIEVAGHTDSIGSDAYNDKLSRERAQAVANYLTGRGISGQRLIITGAGERYPIASNDTEEGRAKNRRVEFKILTQ